MKKIINGKLYDTDTAKELGIWSNGLGWGDFRNMCEKLYRKRTGEFFLYGQGGAMTKYAEAASGGGWTGGEKIIPLTWNTAREWAEKSLDAEEYAEIFGMPDEDAEPVALNVQLDAELMARIRAKAAEDGTSLTATVTALLGKGLEI